MKVSKVFSSTALKIFFEKSLTTPKKLERGHFGIFLYPVCRKTQKKLRGDPLGKNFSKKKSRNAEKTERGTLWSRPALYVMRKTF